MSALFAVARSSVPLRAAARTLSVPSGACAFPVIARLYSSGKFPPHTVINMPALSPTMTQGGIAAWSKQVGDELAPGEAIAEIETDKASMDFEFQEDGYLAKILVQEGAKDIPVGQPIAVYVESADEVPAFENFTAADAGEAPKESTPPSTSESKSESESNSETSKSSSADQKPSSLAVSKSTPTDRVIASPLAKTIALDKGIVLKNVKGTGPNGRIIAKDVENYKAPAAQASGASAATSNSASGPAFEDTPISTMRKVIADRLLQSTQQSPSYIVQSQISVSKLLKLRKALNESAEDRYKLSINDLLIKAIALAALRVPAVNSSWLGAEGVIRTYSTVDVSVAVATPTGLITPIVRDAHTAGLASISATVKDLGKRAKAGKLAPHEFQGGTICISNLGMNKAVNSFTSIINPPQSCILAIGTLDKKAVPLAVNEQGFVFDDIITITGTFDHRTVDGAVGGEYINALKKIVENPLEMMI